MFFILNGEDEQLLFFDHYEAVRKSSSNSLKVVYHNAKAS